MLAFALAASLFTGLATGILPALRSSPLNLTAALNDGGHASMGVSGRRLRSSLVAAEIALSLALLTGAGLLIRSFVAIVSVNPGFQAEQVTAIELNPPPGRFTTWAAWHDFFSDVVIRVRSMPGVTSVATTTNLPLSGVDASLPIVVEHGAASPANRAAQISAASPGYFRTMGIPLVAGREFTPSDETGKVGVAIVNERFARMFFPGENPIGKRAQPFFGGPAMREIIGVVADVHHTALTANADPIFYTLAAQAGPGRLIVPRALASRPRRARARGACGSARHRSRPTDWLGDDHGGIAVALSGASAILRDAARCIRGDGNRPGGARALCSDGSTGRPAKPRDGHPPSARRTRRGCVWTLAW